ILFRVESIIMVLFFDKDYCARNHSWLGVRDAFRSGRGIDATYWDALTTGLALKRAVWPRRSEPFGTIAAGSEKKRRRVGAV
ncbi:hypothetical protein, partial [Serratia sp. OLBL1]